MSGQKGRLLVFPATMSLPNTDGGEARLLGTGVMEGACEACDGVFWVPSNMGTLSCPYCRSTQVKRVWRSTRVVLMPQEPAPRDDPE